jgi:nucleotide-binding universal stress UspA family protein
MGARNLGTMHRWLVGSVSRSVLHLADASVLIVRPGVGPVGERPEEWAVPA